MNKLLSMVMHSCKSPFPFPVEAFTTAREWPDAGYPADYEQEDDNGKGCGREFAQTSGATTRTGRHIH